jgi:ribosomal protein S12
MKRLIQTELGKVASNIFYELVKGKDISQQSPNSESILVQHTTVACDGCGVSPIIGIRYKCIVCKNFDYCEVCEERITHEHSFIKILRPENAPASIITGIVDNEPH